MAIDRPQIPVIPRPLHNHNGTILSLARQTLADLDRHSVNTTMPTATLVELLTVLCEALDRAPLAPAAVRTGALLETSENPNLRYWQQRAESDE